MQRLMLKLDGFLRRRRAFVLIAWLVILVAAAPFALKQSDNLTGGGFAVPGSDSEQVLKTVKEDFPGAERARLAIVAVPRDGASAGEVRAALERAGGAAPSVSRVAVDPAALRQALASVEEGKPALLPLRVGTDEDLASDVAGDLRERLGIGETGVGEAVSLHLVGQGALWAGLEELSKKDLETAETTGFPIVLLILLGVFGSFSAALLPLALGLVSVFVTGALIWLISQQVLMSVFVTNMASMIGIGVAVDYSLFVVARYREEIRAGREPEDARARAMATSGVAVVFSGVTVIVSLAGLYLIPATAIRSMALGAILVVAVSILASATLLPVLMRLLGHRAYARSRLFTVAELVARSRTRRRRGSTHPDAPTPPTFWARWTEAVMRRPVLAATATATVLLVLAIPTLSVQTGDGALRQFPEGHETRVGLEAAAALTGPGEVSPVQVLVEFRYGRTGDDPQNAGALADVQRTLSNDPDVVRVWEPVPSRDGRAVLLSASTRSDAEALETKALVARLRDGFAGTAAAKNAEMSIGGATAQQKDFADLVAGSMWKMVLFVLLLSYFVLMVLLRSVVLPLKAVLMNLLSVGAAYGVLVAVFQWGWVDGLFGFESPGRLDTLTLPLVLAVTFGLSMDYEVFLLSRIRERYEVHRDTRRAVAEGLASSARTITSAALIMVAVFAVFIGTGVPSIKQIGLGNAVAIAVDATLVRLVLVPAAMELLGRWNWYLPRRLDRLLPRSSFERIAEPAAGKG